MNSVFSLPVHNLNLRLFCSHHIEPSSSRRATLSIDAVQDAVKVVSVHLGLGGVDGDQVRDNTLSCICVSEGRDSRNPFIEINLTNGLKIMMEFKYFCLSLTVLTAILSQGQDALARRAR